MVGYPLSAFCEFELSQGMMNERRDAQWHGCRFWIKLCLSFHLSTHLLILGLLENSWGIHLPRYPFPFWHFLALIWRDLGNLWKPNLWSLATEEEEQNRLPMINEVRTARYFLTVQQCDDIEDWRWLVLALWSTQDIQSQVITVASERCQCS